MAFPPAVCREIAKECTLFAVRSSSRALTQLYEEALAPAGLKATQLSLLVAAAARSGWTVSALAAALHLDRTTLTRNLQPLVRKGLLQVGAGRDRRSSSVAIRPGRAVPAAPTRSGKRPSAASSRAWAGAAGKP